MDRELRSSMLRYYDERAREYDEAYTKGTGTSSLQPVVFTAESRDLPPIVSRAIYGRVLDLACGTAHWLPAYAAQCTHVTLVDQSPRMLAEARKRVEAAGIAGRCSFVCQDLFEFSAPRAAFDTVLAGFLLSHLAPDEEPAFFDILRAALDRGGRFLIMDSAWTPERATVNHKIERQPRALNDGTTFEIYKRYLDRDDVAGWSRYGVETTIEHLGRAFIAVTGRFSPGPS